MQKNNIKTDSCLVMFSGGTDSTCVAALMAERVSKIHLITYYEQATKNTPIPFQNVERLKNHFTDVEFYHETISTDRLLRNMMYENYFKTFWKYGFFVLANCGFSSLSWHVTSIVYCLDHEIHLVADGLTRELMHFPGHMDSFNSQIRALYATFGIEYINPVRDWDVPEDQQFLDRLIVGRHGFISGSESKTRKTTGQYLFDLGLMPHPNVKGSEFDRKMQHDCYPFVLFNIFIFWYYLSFHSFKSYQERISVFFGFKIKMAEQHLRQYESDRRGRYPALLMR